MLCISRTYHRTNAFILTEIKIKTRRSSVCLQRIPQFFGHVTRRDEENFEKLIVSGIGPGIRARNRRSRWTDQIQQRTGVLFSESFRRAEDRLHWRSIMH